MFILPPSLLEESILLDVIEYLPAGVFCKDADDNFRFVIWNAEMERIFSNDRRDMLGKNDYDFFEKEEANYYRQTDEKVMDGDKVVHIGRENVTTNSGIIIAHTIKVPVTLNDGRRLLLGIIEDISENENNKEKIFNYQFHLEQLVEEKTLELKQLAQTDLLTNLSNRRFFYETLETLLINNKSYTLIYLDLDRFKLINDTFGHNLGDIVLREIGIRLSSILDYFVSVGRIGGDEFALLIDNSINKNIDDICEIIFDLIIEPIIIENRIYKISCAMGLSNYPDDAKNAKQLLQFADNAMYFVKQKHTKKPYAYFNSIMHLNSKKEFEIEQAFYYAFLNKEFEIYYQPQYNIHSSNISGCEALIRWNSEILNNISPEIFIPASEISGDIHRITEFVISQVCKDLDFLKKYFNTDFNVSINLSTFNMDSGLLNRILEKTTKYNIDTSKITLEIVENNELASSDEILITLNNLRNAGFKISIDDFGTGYSSLSYLSKFDLDEVKIDKSFIQDYKDKKKATVIEAITAISNVYGYNIVAEGVETIEQLEYLKKIGIHSCQGYLFDKPMPFKNLLEKFHHQKK
jgi:diguanylate cyclase (GGDEF)-like protein/PAS domain S-box-containing protein